MRRPERSSRQLIERSGRVPIQGGAAPGVFFGRYALPLGGQPLPVSGLVTGSGQAGDFGELGRGRTVGGPFSRMGCARPAGGTDLAKSSEPKMLSFWARTVSMQDSRPAALV